jgi:hypothetical protein
VLGGRVGEDEVLPPPAEGRVVPRFVDVDALGLRELRQMDSRRLIRLIGSSSAVLPFLKECTLSPTLGSQN